MPMTNVFRWEREREHVRVIHWPNYPFSRNHSVEYFHSSIIVDDGKCSTLIYFDYSFIVTESIDVLFDFCVFIPTLYPSSRTLYGIRYMVYRGRFILPLLYQCLDPTTFYNRSGTAPSHATDRWVNRSVSASYYFGYILNHIQYSHQSKPRQILTVNKTWDSRRRQRHHLVFVF